ncbi:MAG: TRAP transporter small permease [Granulosicoccus sp.]
MLRLFALSEWVPKLMASLALFLLMILTFSDVILRSVFNAPIEFAADLTRLLMAIMVFSALPVLSAQGKHISVDLLDGSFDRSQLTRWRNAFTDFFSGAILVLPASRIYDLAERSRSYGDLMEYLRLPLHYIGWFIATMTALTAVIMMIRGLGFVFMPARLSAQHD